MTHDGKDKAEIDTPRNTRFLGFKECSDNLRHPIMMDRKIFCFIVQMLQEYGIKDTINSDGKTCYDILQDRINEKDLQMTEYDSSRFFKRLRNLNLRPAAEHKK